MLVLGGRDPRPGMVNFLIVRGVGGNPILRCRSITRRAGTVDSQHQRQSRHSGCDSQSRQSDPADLGTCGFLLGQPAMILGIEINDQPHDRDRLEFNATDAQAADLDPPGQFGGRADQQSTRISLNICAVVGDQSR